MARLSKVIKNRLRVIQTEQIPHYALIIWRKENGCTIQPDWMLEKSADYYRGLLDGAYTQLENLLMDYGVYEGYNELKFEVPTAFIASTTKGDKQFYQYRIYGDFS